MKAKQDSSQPQHDALAGLGGACMMDDEGYAKTDLRNQGPEGGSASLAVSFLEKHVSEPAQAQPTLLGGIPAAPKEGSLGVPGMNNAISDQLTMSDDRPQTWHDSGLSHPAMVTEAHPVFKTSSKHLAGLASAVQGSEPSEGSINGQAWLLQSMPRSNAAVVSSSAANAISDAGLLGSKPLWQLSLSNDFDSLNATETSGVIKQDGMESLGDHLPPGSPLLVPDSPTQTPGPHREVQWAIPTQAIPNEAGRVEEDGLPGGLQDCPQIGRPQGVEAQLDRGEAGHAPESGEARPGNLHSLQDSRSQVQFHATGRMLNAGEHSRLGESIGSAMLEMGVPPHDHAETAWRIRPQGAVAGSGALQGELSVRTPQSSGLHCAGSLVMEEEWMEQQSAPSAVEPKGLPGQSDFLVEGDSILPKPLEPQESLPPVRAASPSAPSQDAAFTSAGDKQEIVAYHEGAQDMVSSSMAALETATVGFEQHGRQPCAAETPRPSIKRMDETGQRSEHDEDALVGARIRKDVEGISSDISQEAVEFGRVDSLYVQSQTRWHAELSVPSGPLLLARDEEDRIAQELAELEKVAEAAVLLRQKSLGLSSARTSRRSGDVFYDAELGVELDALVLHQKAMVEAGSAVSSRTGISQRSSLSHMPSYEPEPAARPFSPPPGAAAYVAPPQIDDDVGMAYEPPEYQGMLFYDGVDARGRPVVVVNADVALSVPSKRKAALEFILHRLEPIITQGPYVLVLVNTGHNKSGRMPSGWLFQAWRKLTRPFRKNVAYIVLVRPSKWLKTLLAMIRPFLSRKAHRKVLVAESLLLLPDLTQGEVNLHHLGPRFAVAASEYILGGLSSVPASHNLDNGPPTSLFSMPSVTPHIGNLQM
eukprot:jgi/Botrbrau1/4448/Bobra.0348s0036.3